MMRDTFWLMKESPINNQFTGTSLAVRWLRLHASHLGVWMRSLVEELRPHVLGGAIPPKIVCCHQCKCNHCHKWLMDGWAKKKWFFFFFLLETWVEYSTSNREKDQHLNCRSNLTIFVIQERGAPSASSQRLLNLSPNNPGGVLG